MSPRRHTLVLAASALATAAMALVSSPAALTAPTVRLQPVNHVETPIERSVDTLRRTAKLPSIRHSDELRLAAEAHAALLARSGTFTHNAPGENSFSLRLQNYYPARGFQSWATGENIFWAHKLSSPAQVVKAWLASPPHRANLYDPRWRHVGIAAVRVPVAPGFYRGADVTIVVIEFGTRTT